MLQKENFSVLVKLFAILTTLGWLLKSSSPSERVLLPLMSSATVEKYSDNSSATTFSDLSVDVKFDEISTNRLFLRSQERFERLREVPRLGVHFLGYFSQNALIAMLSFLKRHFYNLTILLLLLSGFEI